MTTLVTMRGRVKTGIGGKQGFDTEVDLALNEAQIQHVITVKPAESQESATFSIVSATASYNIITNVNADAYAIMYVRNTTDDEPLVQGTVYEWHLQNQDGTVSSNVGKPHKWVHVEDDIVLYDKIPDATARTIKVLYLTLPVTMTTAVDFELQKEHERPVEQLAKSLLWLDLGNEAKAASALQAYQELVTSRFEPEQVEDENAIFQMQPIDNLYEAD